MEQADQTPAPMLATPLLALLRAPKTLGLAAVLAMLCAGAFIWISATYQQKSVVLSPVSWVPGTLADLSERVVTQVNNENPRAVASAVAALRVPPAQRAEIEREVISKRRRIGWIVLTDSIDPDGDVVAVESDGIVQHVLLNKAWVPVAILISDMIGITAVRDGGGGGVTVALATRNGSQAVRIMAPGEHISVVP
jgi:hypothetical protein